MSVKLKKQLQFIYSLFGILISIVSAAVIALSVYIFVQFIVRPNSPPTIFGVTPQIVMTNDMSGNNVGHVESGDLVFIKKVQVDTISIQNVVAYIDNGSLFISRVTDIQTNGNIKLLVRADNAEEEFLINDTQVLGTITQRVACVGGFIYFTQSVIGIIIFIAIPTLVLLTILVCEIVVKSKKSKDDKADTTESANADDKTETTEISGADNQTETTEDAATENQTEAIVNAIADKNYVSTETSSHDIPLQNQTDNMVKQTASAPIQTTTATPDLDNKTNLNPQSNIVPQPNAKSLPQQAPISKIINTTKTGQPVSGSQLFQIINSKPKIKK